ncbi:hypothetical protein HPB47_021097 [Ixodes persulcatus]|uniref:Uncharacterized protein n=1 Tax=Ixodes persulcatus TaxID=34615 RepID=A0AC60QEF1_IXOPE|nr:hypothetical protein HPB47_021097 [Ixodes persulcatus]
MTLTVTWSSLGRTANTRSRSVSMVDAVPAAGQGRRRCRDPRVGHAHARTHRRPTDARTRRRSQPLPLTLMNSGSHVRRRDGQEGSPPPTRGGRPADSAFGGRVLFGEAGALPGEPAVVDRQYAPTKRPEDRYFRREESQSREHPETRLHWLLASGRQMLPQLEIRRGSRVCFTQHASPSGRMRGSRVR